jgi:NAD(P)-dependent dehydrogenase (short-subunit alcohol dehydrogenase family)
MTIHSLAANAVSERLLAGIEDRDENVLPGPRRRVFDIVVSNAAHQHAVDRIEDISTDQFDTTFKTNVYTMF